MKTPIWEQSPGALVALINTGAFVYVTLYTITLAGGNGTLRVCDGDFNVTDGTNTWDSRGVRVDMANSRSVAHWKRGLDVDNWQTVFLPRNVDPATGAAYPDKIGNVPWVAAARAGALDGAAVNVDRAYFAAFPTPYQLTALPVGILRMFAGRMAEVDTGDSVVAVTINDWRELLLTKLPRGVFQAGCRFTLYGPGCALNPTSFAIPGIAGAGSTQRTIIAAAPIVPGGSGTFTLGKITMTSGLCTGFSRTVTNWTAPNTMALLNPFPFTIAAGDTFNAYPGCNKTTAACAAFGNSINFGGMPTIPQAETAV